MEDRDIIGVLYTVTDINHHFTLIKATLADIDTLIMGTGISIADINTLLVGIDTPVEDIGVEAIEAAIIVDESD